MADIPSSQTDYDRLWITKVFFFFALVLMLGLAVMNAAYTFYMQAPFHTVLSAERELFGSKLPLQTTEDARRAGDKIYDTVFVMSGIESMTYAYLSEPSANDIAGDAVRDLKLFSRLADNSFDYMLLISYRLGFFYRSLSFVLCILVATAATGAILRHRKRYGFGDTPLLLNIWARTTIAYAVPASIIVWCLPLALSPALLVSCVCVCLSGVIVFSLSLPKIA